MAAMKSKKNRRLQTTESSPSSGSQKSEIRCVQGPDPLTPAKGKPSSLLLAAGGGGQSCLVCADKTCANIGVRGWLSR